MTDLQTKADAMAETINAIAALCTYQHESKEDFIGRVRAVLGEDPDLRVSSVRKERDELLAAICTQAATDVLAERQRQITAEGWTPEHDDQHEVGELATAAACYAGNAGGYVWQGGWPGEVWPWPREYWKPSTPRRDLVKSAAMILAEIERIDRAASASAKGGV